MKIVLREQRENVVLRAWAAGFFDGEGYVGIHKNGHGRGFYLEAKASNTDREPLDKLQREWGGSVTPHNSSSVGAKPAWQWTISARAAAAFLTDIQPYLVMAKNRLRVEIGLEFQTGKPMPGHRLPEDRLAVERKIKDQISAINVRGIPVGPQGRL